MEEASGGRMHYMFNRVGGLKEDVPAGWLGRVVECRRGSAWSAPRARVAHRRQRDPRGAHARRRRARRRHRARPTACRDRSPGRAALDVDLRRDDPYLAYAELFGPGGPGRVVTRTDGDCLARLEVLLEQVHVSLDLAEACLDTLALAAGRTGQPAAAQGAQGARGRALHGDREPPRLQRLPPRLPRREDAVAAQAALGVVQQRPGARRRCCRAASSPTWWPCSGRCSSSSGTSTSSPRRPGRVSSRDVGPDDSPPSLVVTAVGPGGRANTGAAVHSSAPCGCRPQAADLAGAVSVDVCTVFSWRGRRWWRGGSVARAGLCGSPVPR